MFDSPKELCVELARCILATILIIGVGYCTIVAEIFIAKGNLFLYETHRGEIGWAFLELLIWLSMLLPPVLFVWIVRQVCYWYDSTDDDDEDDHREGSWIHRGVEVFSGVEVTPLALT